MLEVGNGDLTYAENVSHFTMWCMMAAPLMCGNDLRDMPAEVLYILSNKEVIAIDQDAKGIQGHVAIPLGDREIWIKELSGNDWAVCFLNRGEKEWNLDFNWTDIAEIRDAGTTFTVRDLWLHKEIGKTTKNVVSTIPAHGVLMTRLSPEVIPTRRRGK
jgi:alpha-galactosidase